MSGAVRKAALGATVPRWGTRWAAEAGIDAVVREFTQGGWPPHTAQIARGALTENWQNPPRPGESERTYSARILGQVDARPALEFMITRYEAAIISQESGGRKRIVVTSNGRYAVRPDGNWDPRSLDALRQHRANLERLKQIHERGESFSVADMYEQFYRHNALMQSRNVQYVSGMPPWAPLFPRSQIMIPMGDLSESELNDLWSSTSLFMPITLDTSLRIYVVLHLGDFGHHDMRHVHWEESTLRAFENRGRPNHFRLPLEHKIAVWRYERALRREIHRIIEERLARDLADLPPEVRVSVLFAISHEHQLFRPHEFFYPRYLRESDRWTSWLTPMNWRELAGKLTLWITNASMNS